MATVQHDNFLREGRLLLVKIPDDFMDKVSAGTACNQASIVEFTLSRAIYKCGTPSPQRLILP